MKPKKKPHWVDCLLEKHECFGYDRTKKVPIDYKGEKIELLVPDFVHDFKSKKVTVDDGLMTVIGQQSQIWNGEHVGVVLIAKVRPDDKYEVVIWHELYPWALKHLGLVPEESEPQSK